MDAAFRSGLRLLQAATGARRSSRRGLNTLQAARNTSLKQARLQSLALLNQHLAAAVILQDRMRRSPCNLMGENFIMIDDMCDQVASLMESCTMLIADRLLELGGTVRWPVLLDEVVSRQSEGHLIGGSSASEPLDAFGQWVLDAATVATAYGDTTTAVVMEQIWRGVDRQLWKAPVQMDHRR